MRISDTFFPEFDHEMAVTRTVLERVPSNKGDWKPHPKSFPLAHLAQLIAMLPGWMVLTLRQTELDLSAGGKYSTESTDTLLKMFDKNVKDGREAMMAASDADYMAPWSLKHGDKVLMTLPRVAVVRQNISHLVHHRGQMTVYLRLLDVPVPSVYGPTADEGWNSTGQ